MDDRSRANYRHYPQEHGRDTSPSLQYGERTSVRDTGMNHRYSESSRGPGQLAERARMLPSHSHMDHLPVNATSHGVGSKNSDTAKDSSGHEHAPLGPPIRSRDDRQIDDPHSIPTMSIKKEAWPEGERVDASLASQETGDKGQNAAGQLKRRPKAEQEKRSAKVKTDDKDVPTEDGKGKTKRGRKPKAKDNPLEGPPLPPSMAPGASMGGGGATVPTGHHSETPKVTNGTLKRQRGNDLNDAGGRHDGAGILLDGSDSDQEDYSQHKDLMTYMLEVHKRGQKVQKAYEKQASVRISLLMAYSCDYELFEDGVTEALTFLSGIVPCNSVNVRNCMKSS